MGYSERAGFESFSLGLNGSSRDKRGSSTLERKDPHTLADIEAILILLIAVAALATLANRIGVPYPILLVLGGLVLGFVPGLLRVELYPEVVFLLFLPPLLYVSALFTSWRDFRANLRRLIQRLAHPDGLESGQRDTPASA